MTGWLDKVKTSVNPIVNDFGTVDPILLLEIKVKPRLDVLYDGLPAR
jgi:hypothetical protein